MFDYFCQLPLQASSLCAFPLPYLCLLFLSLSFSLSLPFWVKSRTFKKQSAKKNKQAKSHNFSQLPPLNGRLIVLSSLSLLTLNPLYLFFSLFLSFSLLRFHSISLHAAAPLPYAISLMQSELNRVSIVPTLNDCLLPASNSPLPTPPAHNPSPPLEVRYLVAIACNLAVANCVAFGWLQPSINHYHLPLSAASCSVLRRATQHLAAFAVAISNP